MVNLSCAWRVVLVQVRRMLLSLMLRLTMTDSATRWVSVVSASRVAAQSCVLQGCTRTRPVSSCVAEDWLAGWPAHYLLICALCRSSMRWVMWQAASPAACQQTSCSTCHAQPPTSTCSVSSAAARTQTHDKAVQRRQGHPPNSAPVEKLAACECGSASTIVTAIEAQPRHTR